MGAILFMHVQELFFYLNSSNYKSYGNIVSYLFYVFMPFKTNLSVQKL